jgi:hypothetical protein
MSQQSYPQLNILLHRHSLQKKATFIHNSLIFINMGQPTTPPEALVEALVGMEEDKRR